jgi:diphthamide synthase (EF-2-diphthine--ammonia ligase)
LLATDFINVGFKTIICAADARLLGRHSVGEQFDHNFLKTLPAEVDPCGENGEFHSFVFDGPIFKKPIEIREGEIVERAYSYQKRQADGSIVKCESAFWFQELDLVS